MATAVEVVELGLGDAVVDVDRREQQLAGLLHPVQAVDAGGGLLGDAPDAGGDLRPALRVVGQRGAQRGEEDVPLLGVVVGGVRDGAGGLELGTLVDQHGGVAAIVEDEVGAPAPGPTEDLLGGPPVLLEGLALPCEDRDAAQVVGRPVGSADGCSGGVVLGGEDVAAGPADLGAEGGQRLDQHRRLHGHVQRAGDAGPGEGLFVGELGPQRHESRHLVLGQANLVAAELVQGQVGNAVVLVQGHDDSFGLLGTFCRTGRGPGGDRAGVV